MDKSTKAPDSLEMNKTCNKNTKTNEKEQAPGLDNWSALEVCSKSSTYIHVREYGPACHLRIGLNNIVLTNAATKMYFLEDVRAQHFGDIAIPGGVTGGRARRRS